jgi:hypothetical protein
MEIEGCNTSFLAGPPESFRVEPGFSLDFYANELGKGLTYVGMRDCIDV